MKEPVSDANVLISLLRIGQQALLQDLFGTVLVPEKVRDEIGPELKR
ncbi:MAG: hypothetical protein NZ959_03055 [Armatimonadetes bacterium]|nr:hypothetical protein [Armatimonadota bacterium]MDW8121570.1 hypothetical protein [Armatimonadota bacterium]